jgi:hypothetical protein
VLRRATRLAANEHRQLREEVRHDALMAQSRRKWRVVELAIDWLATDSARPREAGRVNVELGYDRGTCHGVYVTRATETLSPLGLALSCRLIQWSRQGLPNGSLRNPPREHLQANHTSTVVTTTEYRSDRSLRSSARGYVLPSTNSNGAIMQLPRYFSISAGVTSASPYFPWCSPSRA